MAKNIDFMGATFPDVPSIRLPQHEGGLVSFDDTSDGDIVASDVAQGKIGYAQGQRVVGTAVVPTGSQTYTENGTYDVTALAEAVINVAGGGGGGFDYEEGTWTPSASETTGENIMFQNQHTGMPLIVIMADATGTGDNNINATNLVFTYVDMYKLFGAGVPRPSGGAAFSYSHISMTARKNAAMKTYAFLTNYNSDESGAGSNYPEYWVSSTRFYPWTQLNGTYWRSTRTYKWIAVWKPTT